MFLKFRSTVGCLSDLNVEQYGLEAVSACGTFQKAGICMDYGIGVRDGASIIM